MEDFKTATEGKATVLYPKDSKVFYNPIQQFNRDISICAIQAWTQLFTSSKKRGRDSDDPKPFIHILEALSASGLRSIRYAKEIPLVRSIIANDLVDHAVESIARNSKHNGVQAIVRPTQGDANDTMYKQRAKPVHIVDLDPYGGAAPFIDAAVQCVVDGGLLLVTCTDLAVLAGNGYPEKCFSQYGGTTVRNDATHESALRLVLNTVAQAAARHGKAITPLMSLSIDYYLRCFIQVHNSPALVKENMGKSAVVYNCTGCQTTHMQPLGKVSDYVPKNKGKKQRANTQDNEAANEITQQEKKKSSAQPKLYKFGWAKAPVIGPFCQFCENPHHISGPLWSGPLHNQQFLAKLLEITENIDPEQFGTRERIRGMVTLANQELDTPFYVSPANMASRVRCPVPPLKTFVSAILNGGYEASLTHAQAGCIKTNAPADFLWDILRTWAKNQKADKALKDSPGSRILKGDITHEISFEEHPEVAKIDQLRKSKIVCFPMNPRAEWGPMAKPQKEKTNQ